MGLRNMTNTRSGTLASKAVHAAIGRVCDRIRGCSHLVRIRTQVLVSGENASPSMAGEVLYFKCANTVHNVASESYGLSRVAKIPGKEGWHQHRVLLRGTNTD